MYPGRLEYVTCSKNSLFLLSVNSKQQIKRFDMARVNEGSHGFTCQEAQHVG